MDHQTSTRRWRGMIDVPMTKDAYEAATQLGIDIHLAGGLDLVYHDGLIRCEDTAYRLGYQDKVRKHPGPRPWNMGPAFQGQEITERSLRLARTYIFSNATPPEGESFGDWYDDWMTFMAVTEYAHPQEKIGVVTHNRNIQALYATDADGFHYPVYDCEGPGFLSVHLYHKGYIAPWTGRALPNGIYLIRHGETEWGT